LDHSTEPSEPGEGGTRPACALAPAGADGFQIATYATSDVGEESVVLAAKQADGWAVVAQVTTVYNPGAFGVSEEWSLDGTKEETVGDKHVVRFTITKQRYDSDAGIDEYETEGTESELICVRGEAAAPTGCPLAALTSYKYVRDRIGNIPDDELGDVSDL